METTPTGILYKTPNKQLDMHLVEELRFLGKNEDCG